MTGDTLQHLLHCCRGGCCTVTDCPCSTCPACQYALRRMYTGAPDNEESLEDFHLLRFHQLFKWTHWQAWEGMGRG